MIIVNCCKIQIKFRGRKVCLVGENSGVLLNAADAGWMRGVCGGGKERYRAFGFIDGIPFIRSWVHFVIYLNTSSDVRVFVNEQSTILPPIGGGDL